MRKKFVLLILCLAAVLAAESAFSPISRAEPVKFKAVTFLPVNNEIVSGFKSMVEKINEKFKDDIDIEILGGPEITPPFQLHEAVKSGVVDMGLTSCGYYPSLLWEAQSAMFTNKTAHEIAETDYFEVMSKLHRDVGLIWLGPGTYSMQFYLYSNVSVDSPKDFAGKKIRVFPPFIPLIKALGAVPINLPMGDIYTAMERGAVDGFVMAHIGFVKDFSWHEVTKYVIDYPLYEATAVILVNPKKWDSLPADVRKKIIAFKKDTIDPAIFSYYLQLSNDEWQLMMDKGVKPIKFSQSEGEAFLKMAYDAAWNHVNSKSTELGPRLEKMLVK
jgi:TRAP-type C4-dicarboxylate transport system substrate-binding protein